MTAELNRFVITFSRSKGVNLTFFHYTRYYHFAIILLNESSVLYCIVIAPPVNMCCIQIERSRTIKGTEGLRCNCNCYSLSRHGEGIYIVCADQCGAVRCYRQQIMSVRSNGKLLVLSYSSGSRITGSESIMSRRSRIDDVVRDSRCSHIDSYIVIRHNETIGVAVLCDHYIATAYLYRITCIRSNRKLNVLSRSFRSRQ